MLWVAACEIRMSCWTSTAMPQRRRSRGRFGGWRPSMVWVGVFMLGAGVLWILVFKDRTADGGPSETHNMAANFKTVLKIKDVWLLAVYYGLNMAGIMTVVSAGNRGWT